MIFRLIPILGFLCLTLLSVQPTFASQQTDVDTQSDCFDGCFDDDGNLINPNDPGDGGGSGGGQDPGSDCPASGCSGTDDDGSSGGGDSGSGGDDSNDGGDDSGSDDGGDDSGTDDGSKDKKKGENPKKDKDGKLVAEVVPWLYLDFDFYEEELNLTQHDYFTGNKDGLDYQDYNPDYKNLVYEDYRGGFRVTNYYRLKWGLGAKVRWHFKDASGFKGGLYAYVGILPINGEEIVTVRHVRDRASIESLPEVRKPPEQVSDINQWQLGDRLSYVNSGGVIFKAGAGYHFIGVDVTVVDEGQWRVNLERLNKDFAIVNVQNLEVDRTTIALSAGPAELGKSQIETEGQSFTFKLKMGSSVAQKAYEDLIAGNIAGVQEFLKTYQNQDIQQIEDFELTETGDVNHFFVGLPFFLNAFWGEGQFLGVTERNLQILGQRLKTNYGVFRENTGYKFFGNNKDHSLIFYGNHFERFKGQDVDGKGYFGQFVLTFKRTDTSSKKFLKDITKMSKLLNMQDELMVNVPKDSDLGFVETKVKINLPESLVDHLMERATTEPHDDLVAESLDFIARDLTTVQGYTTEGGELDPQFFTDTEGAVKKMFASLKEMAEIKDKDVDRFVELFAEFGESTLKNEKTFENFVRLAENNYQVDYHLRGEKVSQYSIRLTPANKSGYSSEPIDPEYKWREPVRMP